jgi:adenylate cyclase
MNTASRLESANKQLGTSVIASREAVERSGLDWWRPLGRVRLRGRETPVDIFEPAPDMPAEERAELARLLAGKESSQDIEAAIAELAGRHRGDAGLAGLLGRIKESGCGETYELA